MPTTIRSNDIRGGKPTEALAIMSPGERALRRLRDPQYAIDVLSEDGDIDISNFVCDLDKRGGEVREYHCAGCGAHLLIYFIQTEGTVRCACGPIQGTVV